jgi:site-specific recombinase XerD
MMKNYCPKIASSIAVQKNLSLRLSRQIYPDLAKTKVTSVMTADAHASALTQFAKHLITENNKHLKNASPLDAEKFLQKIALNKRQSTVSLARQAINLHILPQSPVDHVLSMVPTVPINRAYSSPQIQLLCSVAPASLALSINLAFCAGLRVMELVSIGSLSDFSVSRRRWHSKRFSGRENYCALVVHGKGGLLREVRVPHELFEQLMELRRPAPIRANNRRAHLTSYFDLISGHDFSIKFTHLSQQELGFSHGAHGLRHSYAQQRLHELLCVGINVDEAIKVVSQEMGHFAIKNTMVYLRHLVG